MKIAQSRGLDRSAHVKGLILQCVGQVGDQGVADLLVGRAVQDQTKSALVVVLANEDDGSDERRSRSIARYRAAIGPGAIRNPQAWQP